MAYLILVRHSISRPRPDVSSHEWELTIEGRRRCEALTERLRAYEPEVLVTSAERKARQTADLIGSRLDLEPSVVADLGEQRRADEPWLASGEFEARVRALLRHPDELVYGEETGTAAASRLQTALDSVVTRHPGQTIVAVTHSTILSLTLARAADLDAVSVWDDLGMPAYAVLRSPKMELVELVSDID